MTFSYNLTGALCLITLGVLFITISLVPIIYMLYPNYRRNIKLNRWIKKMGDAGKHVSGKLISAWMVYPSGMDTRANINFFVDHIAK